ncbi:replication protein A 14 kDa subunit-like [Physella acuta]|uniref:replication protein A 14 kDa subunit-like n=1 Tax=Physella acuta TaxID=109671 RepID=UPI0027DB0016|nr:replication protein A 14 kDa subunit-like [Physella acuta]
MSLNEFMKPRINGSLLHNYIGKQVCLVGLPKNVENSGNFFTLTTCDNQDVRIQMQAPINQRISSVTEVHGTVTARNSLQCDNIVVFPEGSENFDMSLYQSSIECMLRCPSLYKQGGNTED